MDESQPGTSETTPTSSNETSPWNRRTFLLSAAGTAGLAGLGVAGCSSSGSDAFKTADSPIKATDSTTTSVATSTTLDAQACKLIPEFTSGPYYIDGAAVRRDITEDKPGLPMDIAFKVIDSNTCEPLADAAVDIWHCDANGEYSGWNGNTLEETFKNGRNKKTFLRGVQVTDKNGIAQFTTIYPGWYEGRAIHIHLKVHTGGDAASTYTGGHINHVGQVFFDDKLSDKLMTLDPYAAHTGTRTRNDEDSIYANGGAGQIVAVTFVKKNDPTAGFTANVTMAVNPKVVPTPLPLA